MISTKMTSDWDMFSGDEPTEELIAEMKAEYGPLFRTQIEGVPYYFRTLTRRDAVELGLNDGFLDPDAEEAVFQRTLVHPKKIVDFNELPLGAPAKVVQEVLERSGLAGAKWLNTYISRARASMTAYHTIAATVCAAFPSLLPASLDDLNISELMELVVLAEEVLSIKSKTNWQQYSPLEFEGDDIVEENKELSQQEKDAMVRAMLENGMDDVPAGWIDKTKKRPSFANDVPDPSQDI
jgi:hypothetical protein